ncbi:hypothetical protein RHMOL_Rhmol13G0277100 [Rhododendron molle]|uniref:Uncharacterized protein n=1 Tax=Rhododendron molle TaxID=49168 RepID=A0ACC0LD18_RHOML|nr:hypothetical protein RHMOL_Rhmol13G0277100 [Rhododendron molle]
MKLLEINSPDYTFFKFIFHQVRKPDPNQMSPGMTVGPRPWPQGAVSSTEQRTQATEMEKRRDELKVF